MLPTHQTDSPLSIPYGKCHCGCGEDAPVSERNCAKYGWTKGEPKRYVLGHSRRKSPHPHLVDAETGCWIWQRGRNTKGYGVAYWNGEELAHRAYYKEHVGEIPPGRHVHHTCENPLCVNPEHLRIVTPAEHRQGHAMKLDRDKVKLIRESSLSSRKLGAMLGISHRMVLDVRNGKYWKAPGA